MENELILNIIGYAGSALVLMSFLMASVLKLRIINIAGSVASVVYSLLIHAYPTVVMNAALIIINIYYIVKILKQKNIYHVVDTETSDKHLAYFLDYYKADIALYFPEFKLDSDVDVIKFLYCESTPVSVFCGKKAGGDTVEVVLDYAVPAYRDCSAGKYIYENLAGNGFRNAVLRDKTKDHDRYLKNLGFTRKEDAFEKILQLRVNNT